MDRLVQGERTSGYLRCCNVGTVDLNSEIWKGIVLAENDMKYLISHLGTVGEHVS